MGLEITVDATALDVRVTGADRWCGFRSRLEVPTARIVSAGVQATSVAKKDVSIRVAGIVAPGLALVGHLRGRTATRQYSRVYRADRVVVIDLDVVQAIAEARETVPT